MKSEVVRFLSNFPIDAFGGMLVGILAGLWIAMVIVWIRKN